MARIGEIDFQSQNNVESQVELLTANFCLKCGHALETRNIGGTDRRACPNCDFVFWGDYSIGVGALVMNGGKVLLVRRAQDPGKGHWTNPGGYCEQFEMLEETVVREVREETGVSASVTSVIALRDQPRQIHNVYIVYAMEYIEGEPTPDGVEVDQAGFYGLDEMESMNVAALTRWLVDVAVKGKTVGLVSDTSQTIAPLNAYGLFRIPATNA